MEVDALLEHRGRLWRKFNPKGVLSVVYVPKIPLVIFARFRIDLTMALQGPAEGWLLYAKACCDGHFVESNFVFVQAMLKRSMFWSVQRVDIFCILQK